MKPQIVPPIVVDEHGDINMHPDVSAAEQSVEAIDVLNDEYDFFDSRGLRLHATVKDGEVFLGATDERLSEPDELADRLRGWIVAVGPERVGITDADSASLAVLVDRVSTFLT